MSITAIVESGTIKLPVSVPDGTEVEIILPNESSAIIAQPGSILESLREFVGCIEGPEDMAAEHDHDLYGTPKRDQQ